MIKKQRQLGVEAMRLVAMLMIIYHHAFLYMIPSQISGFPYVVSEFLRGGGS